MIDVPEIPSTATLYLEPDVLVDIFAGNILYWNDSRIQAGNTDIADKLPYKIITKVIRSVRRPYIMYISIREKEVQRCPSELWEDFRHTTRTKIFQWIERCSIH